MPLFSTLSDVKREARVIFYRSRKSRKLQLKGLRFRLAHKGLILVSVPLIFQLIILSGMLMILNQSEEIGRKNIHDAKVIATMIVIAEDMTPLLHRQKTGTLFGSEYARQLHENINTARNDLSSLDTLSEGDQKLRASIGEVVRQVDNFEAAYEKAVQLSGNPTSPTTASINIYLDEYHALLHNTPRLIHEFNQSAMESQTARETEQQRELRQDIVRLLVGALFISVIVSILLAMFFTREITRRVGVISENHRRFVAGQSLLGVISGSDELTDFDKTYHAMAAEVLEARKRDAVVQQLKDQVFAMVTHDLRAPLHTVANFLEFMEDAPVSLEKQHARSKAESDVRDMAQMLNRILDMEKRQGST